MKILVNPIKRKMMPIVAASLLTAGTLTSCTTNNFKLDGSMNKHYIETVTTLNYDLNYLNSAKKTGSIEFGDYYEKSKKVIEETTLNEEKLKEDNKNIKNYVNALLIGSMAGVGLVSLALFRLIEDDKRLLAIPLLTGVLGLTGVGSNYINKDSNEQNYIQEAQKSLQVYKDEKLATLDSLKNEELIQASIETSENK